MTETIDEILARGIKYLVEYERNRKLGHSHAFCAMAAQTYMLSKGK